MSVLNPGKNSPNSPCGETTSGGSSRIRGRVALAAGLVLVVPSIVAMTFATSASASTPAKQLTVSATCQGIEVTSAAGFQDNDSITVNFYVDGTWQQKEISSPSSFGDYTPVAVPQDGVKHAWKITADDGTWQHTYTGKVGPCGTTSGSPSPSPECQSNLHGATGSAPITGLSVKYTVTIPKPACSDLAASGDSYLMPPGYDGSGNFDSTASPQSVLMSPRTDLVIKAGSTSVTVTKSLGITCGWVQSDAYTGKHQDTVTWPAGNVGWLGGVIVNLGVCAPKTSAPPSSSTPAPSTSAPTTSPGSSTSTSHGATSPGSSTATTRHGGSTASTPSNTATAPPSALAHTGQSGLSNWVLGSLVAAVVAGIAVWRRRPQWLFGRHS